MKRFMKKRFGFTLAEVLITLGIIGVVAAMTIPTLMQNTNNVRFASQFKKSLSTVNQAGLMAMAQYDVDYGTMSNVCNNADDNLSNTRSTTTTGSGRNQRTTINNENQSICAILRANLAGATAHGKAAITSSNGTTYALNTLVALNGAKIADYFKFTMADGSIVAVPNTARNCSTTNGTITNDMLAAGGGLNKCIGYIDVNGTAMPNKEITCADGTAAFSTTTCTAANQGLGDIFPIVFHDQTVEPATNAARAILTKGK